MKSVTGDELADGWSDKAPSTDVWGNSNVTRFWKSTIPVEMTQGQNKPAYVMCYVNPIDETGISTMTLKEASTLPGSCPFMGSSPEHDDKAPIARSAAAPA